MDVDRIRSCIEDIEEGGRFVDHNSMGKSKL